MNFKTQDERSTYHTKLSDIQKLVVRQGGWRTCLNCINWQGNLNLPERCELYKMTPPAEVIVHGCRDWEDDIPF